MYETLDDIPFNHETDDDDRTGWHYQDPGYGGFLALSETACQIRAGGEEIDVPVVSCIEFTDLDAACGEDGWLVEAKLVPVPEALSDEKRESVAGSCCRWDDDGNPVIDLYDIASYGLCVPIEHVWGAETWEEGFSQIRDAAYFSGSVGVGFALDGAWNRMGTTGWDLIRDAVLDEDAFQKSLDRLRKLHGKVEA